MAEDRNDMLMRFVRSNGQALDAECTAQLNPNDDLVDDFVRGKFFEVEDFGFAAGLDDDEMPKEIKVESDGHEPKKTAPKPFRLKFARWMRAGPNGARGYRADVDTVEFTRLMDRGSTLFFQDLCGVKTFESATLVKRRATGSEQGMQSYLRIDFTDVLLIDLDWSEADNVKEKYKFICRGVLVQYKPQGSSGALGAAIPGGWQQASR